MVDVRPTYDAMKRLKEYVYDCLELERLGYFSCPIPEDIRARMVKFAECIEASGADEPHGPVL